MNQLLLAAALAFAQEEAAAPIPPASIAATAIIAIRVIQFVLPLRSGTTSPIEGGTRGLNRLILRAIVWPQFSRVGRTRLDTIAQRRPGV